ncbi:unnamed protein product [Rotaria socialis]|uniref:Xaa-Pro dipeptidyl-peptidase-like domain-containing protein n=1 Tax=Rotaria socialis TaxID=392032 RepID=A0A820M3A4_9BILA|nr:unnamed protein product [Rotaria socialis]CAF3372509.1 unnamed protein product [Rotaria socialis]CAF3406551.1 unnamed protein product [Rotaria socialis]CAF3481338.1 unnamed protein product [Rotaria socialis]CAF4366241.1 unnamed protein product [Rotaria socialis]
MTSNGSKHQEIIVNCIWHCNLSNARDISINLENALDISFNLLLDVINNFKSINDTDHLASDHRSNGRVGMYGISWSGFNTLMMSTLRRPFALKALFTAHVTDDLYKSDIHYSDGIMHLDQYFIFIDHSNAIPAPIDYNMNDQWTRERFRR